MTEAGPFSMLQSKPELRQQFIQKRKKLSSERRLEAAKALLATLPLELDKFATVLSFVSLPQEIDLSFLNAQLLHQNRLLLPRVEGDCLVCYQVENLCDLEKSSLGIFEPNPQKCLPIPIEQINCVLVPGIAFDQKLHRLGYGKGHYDRFLSQFPYLTRIGLGFTEQLSCDLLPYEAHDQPMTRLSLF